MQKYGIAAVSFGAACLLMLLPSSKATAQTSPNDPQNDPQRAQQNCDRRQILRARSCVGDGLEPEERRLFTLINQYRRQNRLPPIPTSPSLNLVANRHVRDLDQNIRQVTHSWSNCPYNSSDPSTFPCIWNAPQRLGTRYPGFGYENAFGGGGGYRATAQAAFRGWRGSAPHNATILNQGTWQDNRWRALGVGIYGGYAVLWFGEESDPAAAPQ